MWPRKSRMGPAGPLRKHPENIKNPEETVMARAGMRAKPTGSDLFERDRRNHIYNTATALVTMSSFSTSTPPWNHRWWEEIEEEEEAFLRVNDEPLFHGDGPLFPGDRSNDATALEPPFPHGRPFDPPTTCHDDYQYKDDDDDDDEMDHLTTCDDNDHHPDDDDDTLPPEEVLQRIEVVVYNIVQDMDERRIPEIRPYAPNNANSLPQSTLPKKSFTLQQSRSFTNMVLIMAYCHQLLFLSPGSTTTTREVYYFYVTHFRSQRECDAAIADVGQYLQVPRHALGLQAGSRGWFCGDVRLLENVPGKAAMIQWNGRTYRGDQGCPIAADWLRSPRQRSFRLHTVTTATAILVVEKEGIYQRLVQDGFCQQYSCILITGKGFPDYATRACLRAMYRQWNLPIFGLADCDPFGVAVLNCYSFRHGEDEEDLPIQWLGLRPTQVKYFSQPHQDMAALPAVVYQELTDLDRKQLEQLSHPQHPFVLAGPHRLPELQQMMAEKVELEALHWLGMHFCGNFVGYLLEQARGNHAASDVEDALWMQVV